MPIVTTFRRAFDTARLDPYPVQKLHRVDRPTTIIHEDQVQRVDERDNGFSRTARGEYGSVMARERLRFVKKHPLSASLLDMQSLLADAVDGDVAPEKAPLTENPAAMARHIKETAYFLRADIVGICALPPYAVYSHSMPNGEPVSLTHKYAIAIVVDQDWKTAQASVGNDWISAGMSFVAYSTSGAIACNLANYIRRLGYPARAHHARNYQVLVPPILLKAGIGEMSRIGDIVINPFLGPRLKAAIVTTDLPLAVDRPIDIGLQDFCSKCLKCAKYCPSGAISFGGKVMHNGYEKWPLDVEKCAKQRIGNKVGASCGVCITVCPWNKPYTLFHRCVHWQIKTFPALNRLAARADSLLGYGKPKAKNKWWLDLEDIDGRLQVAVHAGQRGNHKPKKGK